MRQGTRIDGWIFFAVAALLAVGIIMVLSTSYLFAQERYSDATYLFRKQMTAMTVGMAALFISALVPSHAYRRFAYPLLVFGLVGLCLVLIPGIGLSRGGARRWLRWCSTKAGAGRRTCSILLPLHLLALELAFLPKWVLMVHLQAL